MKGRKSHLIKQESKKKDVKKVKFPQDLVFDEIVKEGDSSEIVSFLREQVWMWMADPAALCESYGDFNVAKLLLESNADPNVVDNRGLLPIDYTDNFELIELLVSHSNSSAGQDETFHTFCSGDETSH
eukprot:gene13839-4777_t